VKPLRTRPALQAQCFARGHHQRSQEARFNLKPGQKKRIKSALARKRKKRNRDIAQNEIR